MKPGFLRLLLALFLLAVAIPLFAAEQIRIGILATRAKPAEAKRWAPLGDFLNRQIPEHDFTLELMTHDELEAAVASRQVNFVFTSGLQYIKIRELYGLSAPLATLINLDSSGPLYSYGGSIITRSDRKDINGLADLAGKKIATVGPESLGAYQMQVFELVKAGLPLPRAEQLLVTGLPHDNVVNAVLEGKADAGFVRGGMVESMAREGKLDAAKLKVINRQNLTGFPAQVSTRLYPEWPVAALPHTDSDLSGKLAAALYLIERDRSVVEAIGIYGFGVPANYVPVEDLMRTLRLPPFDLVPKVTLADIWNQQRWNIVASLLTVGIILVLSVRLGVSNRRLAHEKAAVLEQAGKLRESEQNLIRLNDTVREAEERWRFALEGSGDGVWDWDVPSGKTMFSKRWKAMIGYGEDEFTDSFDAWTASMHPEDKPRVISAVQDYFDGKTAEYVVEFRMHCKDGSWKWILARGIAVSRDAEGKPLRMLGTHTDITGRKQAEEALHRSNADLERFAYSVSHDMRQPLRAVSGHLQLLQRSLKDKLDESERENMNFALDGARRMDSMIVSLLEYSRVGRKTESKQLMDSRAPLNEALAFLAPLIGDSGAQVSLNGEWPQVFASRDELTRLFQNLIGNAIKFREPDQPPQVEIDSSVHDGKWQVSVKDHGVGIAPHQIDRLFQFFSRLQSRTRFDGTGMGLALCRRIVDHHNGRIWAESEGEGKGSVFNFELPLQAEVQIPSTGDS